jgi:uncharacterized membrane protein
MQQSNQGLTDEQVEQVLGNLLRVGVVVAALVVALGGVMYLAEYGTAPADHQVFHGQPEELRHPADILVEAWGLRSRGVIQLGLLLLVATPVARVIFSVFAFAREGDWLYVLLTLIVLGVLLYSVFAAHA